MKPSRILAIVHAQSRLHHTIFTTKNQRVRTCAAGSTHLEELDSELRLREDVHAAQIADDLETGWQLHVTAQLLNQLVQHQLTAQLDVVHNALQLHINI